MSADEQKHCAFPGCSKPLPSYAKIPLCDDHKDRIKEGGQKAAGAAIAAAGAVLVVAKDKVIPVAKGAAPKVAKAMLGVVKKKL